MILRVVVNQQFSGTSSPRTDLQKTVTSGIQGSFEFQHVAILLWIDVFIRKKDSDVLQTELHDPGLQFIERFVCELIPPIGMLHR